ncbi:YncE family protein [Sulfitobacter sp. LCG007]
MRRVPELAACLIATSAFAGDIAIVTCQPADEVAVVDLAEGAQRALWDIPGKPAGVTIGAPGEVFVVSPEAKAVRRIEIATGAVLGEVRLDGGPTGIAHDAARGRLIVSDWFNARLWVLDASSLALLETLETGSSPAGIALSPDGRYLATAEKDSDRVSIFDASSLEPLARIAVGKHPYGLRFDPSGRLFVGNVGTSDVSVIDPASHRVLATLPVGERPYGIAFAGGRAFVTNQYAGTISVIALDSLKTVATLEAGEYPEGIDTLPDGSGVAFVNWFDNTLMTLDAQSLELTATVDVCDGPRAFGTFLVRE